VLLNLRVPGFRKDRVGCLLKEKEDAVQASRSMITTLHSAVETLVSTKEDLRASFGTSRPNLKIRLNV
jgi:hypothetical protein